jgi:hypothetical protein
MRSKLADRPDDLAVLDAMESEHALIDPALEALERAFDDHDGDKDAVARRIDEIVVLLRGHLGHEEKGCGGIRAISAPGVGTEYTHAAPIMHIMSDSGKKRGWRQSGKWPPTRG